MSRLSSAVRSTLHALCVAIRYVRLTFMVYARASIVFIYNIILMAVVTKIERLALPVLRSYSVAMDSVVDEWTRVCQTTPYLKEKFFESQTRSVAYCMSNAPKRR